MLKLRRRIRDNLHGSVSITAIENQVLSHEYMQRLRYIRQLGFFHLVFPGATHGRFEHSLGVMEVASRCFYKISENQQRLGEHLSSLPPTLAPTFDLNSGLLQSPYALQTLRLAALLHDIGHNPYSHCAEHLLPTTEEVLKAHPELPPYLSHGISHLAPPDWQVSCDLTQDFHRGGSHEIFTLLLAWRVLTDVLQPHHTMIQDVLALLCSHIPLHKNSPLREPPLKGYEILQELLSGDLDADRMDYLLRDSHQAGVRYGIFDDGRLRDCLLVTYDPTKERFHLALNKGGLAAFEDFLTARQSMFRQLYFHKTSVASEAMMQHIARGLGGWCFPARLEEYAKILDQDLQGILSLRIQNSPHLSNSEKQKLQETTQGLFRNRKLWKNLYERVGSHLEDVLKDPERQRICSQLKEQHIAHEVIISANFLAHPAKEKSLLHFPVVSFDASYQVQVKTFLQEQKEQGRDSWLHDHAIYIVRVYTEPSEKLTDLRIKDHHNHRS